jgi:hypothetical protein
MNPVPQWPDPAGGAVVVAPRRRVRWTGDQPAIRPDCITTLQGMLCRTEPASGRREAGSTGQLAWTVPHTTASLIGPIPINPRQTVRPGGRSPRTILAAAGATLAR